MDECGLRRANEIAGFHCEQAECVYWRVVEHLDAHGGPREGCAIQYFALLEGGDEIATWLLSVKIRVDEDGGLGDES